MLSVALGRLPDFALFFVVSLTLVAVYMAIYTLSTSHNEFGLIRQNNVAAALSLGLSLIGFALPLASAVVNAANVVDLLVWGLTAIAIQLFVYWLVRLILPQLSSRIANGELAAALFLGSASLAAGVINAAAMTY
jgi:putative membrane protein